MPVSPSWCRRASEPWWRRCRRRRARMRAGGVAREAAHHVVHGPADPARHGAQEPSVIAVVHLRDGTRPSGVHRSGRRDPAAQHQRQGACRHRGSHSSPFPGSDVGHGVLPTSGCPTTCSTVLWGGPVFSRKVAIRYRVVIREANSRSVSVRGASVGRHVVECFPDLHRQCQILGLEHPGQLRVGAGADDGGGHPGWSRTHDRATDSGETPSPSAAVVTDSTTRRHRSSR